MTDSKMKGYQPFIGDSNIAQLPPPYESQKISLGTVTMLTDSNNPGLGQQPSSVSHINVQLSLPPQPRWPYVIGAIWFLLITGLAVSIYFFCFIPFRNEHFHSNKDLPNSGPHYGTNASQYL